MYGLCNISTCSDYPDPPSSGRVQQKPVATLNKPAVQHLLYLVVFLCITKEAFTDKHTAAGTQLQLSLQKSAVVSVPQVLFATVTAVPHSTTTAIIWSHRT